MKIFDMNGVEIKQVDRQVHSGAQPKENPAQHSFLDQTFNNCVNNNQNNDVKSLNQQSFCISDQRIDLSQRRDNDDVTD